MDRNEILTRLKPILADTLSIDESKITETSDIAADLGADSLDAVELLLAVEDEFDITATDSAVEQTTTVADLVTAIAALS